MNISGIDLNLMVVFEAILAEKNISKAAKKIGLSQPATSSSLNRLRSIYKDPLFTRTPKGMIPTYKALQIEPDIRNALEFLRKTLEPEKKFNPALCEKNFSIAMSDWLSLHIVPTLSKFLRKHAPLINLNVRNMPPDEMHKALMSGELDLGISGLNNLGVGTDKQVLYREHYECLVWSKHSAIKKKLTLDDYVKFPHILFSPLGSGPGAVDQALAKKGLKRRVGLRSVYSLIIPPILENTDLIATIPAPLARFFAKHISVKIFPPPIPINEHDIIQYWSKKNHTDPAHQWLRSVLLEICKGFKK